MASKKVHIDELILLSFNVKTKLKRVRKGEDFEIWMLEEER